MRLIRLTLARAIMRAAAAVSRWLVPELAEPEKPKLLPRRGCGQSR